MTSTSPPQHGVLAETNRLQGLAADPSASAWVSANAGTGKTHVLTNRVLRLLLAGTKPEQILCLTYTKAAAAVMSTRIFDKLAKWVMQSDADLTQTLEKLTGAAPSSNDLARARTLFAQAIETPGGFKVQTIHSFCERLLQRFPLEATVAPNFRTLDEHESREIIRQVSDRVLLAASSEPDHALSDALVAVTAFVSDYSFDDLLAQSLKHRAWLHFFNKRANEARRHLEHAFGLSENDTAEALLEQMAHVLPSSVIERLRTVLAGSGSLDQKLAAALAPYNQAASNRQKRDVLAGYFLTANHSMRARLMNKGPEQENPGLLDQVKAAQTQFAALFERARARELVEASLALTAISEAVLTLYNEQKQKRAALDFEDLIEKSVDLMSEKNASAWVLFKLDEGLSHILVDESQDTSPLQWRLVDHLSNEFFTGAGVHDEPRTIFAVGDEKQSIYSFQGAVPEKFAEQGQKFSTNAGRAGLGWNNIPLTLSFRTVEPILKAVDRVFANTGRTPGVRSADGAVITHAANRIGQGGLVEVWDAEEPEGGVEVEAWLPLGDQASQAPVLRAAERIAGTIKHWLESGELLQSTGAPIKAGDILILVRKRAPFTPAIISALKARGIPVAGADRMNLIEQIAVQDLMSLGDFLTLPEDDLALAEVLKSPIFGLDDSDLFEIAHERKGTLWNALQEQSRQKQIAGWQEAAATLLRWRKLADFSPPYEFFANLLDKDCVRERMLARLGPDAADPIDEFVQLALNYDDTSPPSLSGFLHWMRDSNREIQRDMEHGSNEVRVMTVHGAKGLEAPIVFLPDTCSAPGSGRRSSVLPMAPSNTTGTAFIWSIKDHSRQETVANVKSESADRDFEESNRLLYVAMTRARDRLYISGFKNNSNTLNEKSWYSLVDTAISPMLEAASDHLGRPVRRFEVAQTAERETAEEKKAAATKPAARPEWAYRKAPSEPQLAIPVAPSKLAPYEVDEEGEPLAQQPVSERVVKTPPVASPLVLAAGNRFLRGNVTHALLQYLPAFDPAQRRNLAERFVAARADGLPGRVQTSIVHETLNVIDDSCFKPLFSTDSRAEVPIVALIPNPDGTGAPVRLTGTIDRLADTGEQILVVDYKTNRPSPNSVGEVAEAYLYQLASYRLALRQLYPERTIRCAILWTDVPRLMEISADILNGYEKLLWNLDAALLDAAQSRS